MESDETSGSVAPADFVGEGSRAKDSSAEDHGTEDNICIDMQEILKRIPHRYPFLLIDRAEQYRPHQSIVGIKCVTANEPYFQGHFPGNPVMPGVLIIEALGQAGGVLMSKSLNADVTGKTIFFATVDNCRFRNPVRPGDVLRLCVDVIKHRGDVFKFSGKAYVGDKVAAECEFAAVVVENR